jgi:hypothetical protein
MLEHSTPAVYLGKNEMETNKAKKQVPALIKHSIPVFVLLFLGSDMAAVPAGLGQNLHLSLGWLISAIPVMAVVCYIVGGLALRRRIGIYGWVLSFFAAALLTGTPNLIFEACTNSIQIKRMPTYEEWNSLTNRFRVALTWCSESGRGTRVIVRRSDFDPDMVTYLDSLHLRPDLGANPASGASK